MFEQNLLSCSLVILAGLALASRVEAGHDSFTKHFKIRDRSYERLAENLYKSTLSSELKDNIAAASSEVSKYNGPEEHRGAYDELLRAFTSLKDTSKEDNCDSSSLGSLRQLARGMEIGGNLGPKRISEPIKRLNLIVIKQIMDAEDVCFKYLAKKWHPRMRAEQSSKALGILLDSAPYPLLLDSKPNLKAKEFTGVNFPLHTCTRIMHAEGSNSILIPYLELLMAAYIINPESNKMSEFYKEASEQIVFKPIEHPSKQVLDSAYRLRACDLLDRVRIQNLETSLG